MFLHLRMLSTGFMPWIVLVLSLLLFVYFVYKVYEKRNANRQTKEPSKASCCCRRQRKAQNCGSSEVTPADAQQWNTRGDPDLQFPAEYDSGPSECCL